MGTEMRDAFILIPPDSPWWSLSVGFQNSIPYLGPDSLSYIRSVARHHPSGEMQSLAYSVWLSVLQARLSVLQARRDPEILGEVYAEAMRRLGDSGHSRRLRGFNPDTDAYMRELASEVERELTRFLAFYPEIRESWKKTCDIPHTDHPMPAFHLPSVEDFDHVLTQDSLAGRTWLIAVIDADGGGLSQQFGFYNLLHRKFASKGLRLVFLFHRSQPHSPNWDALKTRGIRLPGFVSSFDDAVFERRIFRNPPLSMYNSFLVDESATIIASGERMRFPEFQYLTLGKLFGEMED